MIDLASFQIARAPRRAEPEDDQKLLLQSQLITAVGNLLRANVALDDPQIQKLITDFTQSHISPLGPVPNPDTDEQYAMLGILALDVWLVRHDDSPASADLQTELTALAKDYQNANRHTAWADILKTYAQDLASWILVWLAIDPPPHDNIATATRLALVTSLAQLDAATIAALKPNDIWNRLENRMVSLPLEFMKAFKKARVELVRAATVSDLNVVRSEWRAYVPGEIAMIRNIMAGETYRAAHKQLGETLTTTTTDTTSSTQTQLDTETQDQSEMSKDVQNQVAVAIQGQVETKYQQMGTGNQFSISAGVSAGVQIGHTEHTASRVAHQAVSKAISTVESTTRESRMQRQLTRTTDTESHSLSGGQKHTRGVYRWVDRIDRYQVFTYPDRLQLEFELPEPAEYVRYRNKSILAASAVTAPPPFTVAVSDITPASDVLALAKKYHATNIPVLPDEQISVVVSKADQPKDLPENPSQTTWAIPLTSIDVDVAVPDGYAAFEVDYSGFALPLRANWESEYSGANKSGGQQLEAFHSILANVYVGSSNSLYFESDTQTLKDVQSVQGMRAGHRWTQYGEAALNIVNSAGNAVAISLNPPASTKFTISAQAQGAAGLAVTAVVKCKRTKEAEDTWRNAVYDALFSAWNDWNSSYQSAQARSALTGGPPPGESSPPKNLQTVRDELKRQVIAWLLNESPFFGRKALKDGGPTFNWKVTDINAALSTAPVIQFMEQAFEWNNISYMFYPYYWADPATWDDLANFQGVDPDFERFLKAGSARVVVPARPGMERAVHHWLLYQQPFLGRPMPIPGDPMFVSVATEIHDMTQPPEDGIPGESWDALLGTTLLWLDPDDKLPSNPLAKLGQPPNEPKEPIDPPA